MQTFEWIMFNESECSNEALEFYLFHVRVDLYYKQVKISISRNFIWNPFNQSIQRKYEFFFFNTRNYEKDFYTICKESCVYFSSKIVNILHGDNM